MMIPLPIRFSRISAAVLATAFSAGFALPRAATAQSAPAAASPHATVAATDNRYAAVRAEFVAALATAELGSPAPADSERLRAYPIYPWLVAARLRATLARAKPDDAAVDTAVAEFLSANGDAPVTRHLRRAWLLSLAERKRWDRYLIALPASLAAADPLLRCQQFAARIALMQTDGLGPAVVEQWQAADKSLPACDAAFDWARAQNLLTPALIEARARLTLKAGYGALATIIAAPLPADRLALIRQWAALIDSPAREIDALIANPERPVDLDALVDGWQRLARKDPDAAAARFDALRTARRLDAASVSPLARALALGYAWSRRPEALPLFAQVQPTDRDALAAEWWARAALWAGDWKQVLQAINGMGADARSEQRWRYWSARAAGELNDPAGKDLLAQLAAEDGWYPALASARIGQPYAPHPQPVAVDATVLAQLDQKPGFVRARELFRASQRGPAGQEFQTAYESLDDAGRRAAIALPIRWGWYEQGVATASKQKVFTDYGLLYPRPYDAPVKAGATLSGLPEALIYGVLRQESLYRADAVSRANAYGLLQMLQETANRTAKKWQRPVPSRTALFDPNVNVPLGAAHLRDLIDRFNGQWPLAIAGYNAGPNAAARWLPTTPTPVDVWVENIPFNETRTYVQRVLWHTLVFGWQQDGKPQKLDHWIAPVVKPGVITPDPADPAP